MVCLDQRGTYIWNTSNILCHLGCYAGLPMCCPSAGVMAPLTDKQMMSPPWEEHLKKQENSSKESSVPKTRNRLGSFGFGDFTCTFFYGHS